MTRSTFKGDFKIELLTEELFEAFPGWKTSFVDINGEISFATKVQITSLPDGVAVLHPETTTRDDIDAILDAHDPSGASRNEKNANARAMNRASGRAKLQGLGLTQDELDSLVGN